MPDEVPTVFFCEKCDTTVLPEETSVKTRSQSGRVRGEEISVEMPVRLCATCGEELSDTALDDAMLIATYDVYRARHNLIFPAEIVALRQKYGLSQKNLALLLGLGEITVHRYETGALAEEAPSKLLRLMENPANMQRMLAESGAKIPDAARAKTSDKIEALLKASTPLSGTKTTGRRAKNESPKMGAMADIYSPFSK